MPYLSWSDNYATNVIEIDIQHRKLFAMVNELDSAMRQGKGKETLGKKLKDLAYYTKSHFETEERFMKENDYPGYEEHKNKHRMMTQKVLQIHEQFQMGQTHITIDVMKFLQNWLSEHILKTDMQFGNFLNNN